MKIDWITRTLAVATALAMGAPVVAQSLPGAQSQMPVFTAHSGGAGSLGCASKGCPVDKSRPSLSEEQRDKLLTLRNKHKLDTAATRAELQVRKSELRHLFSKANIDKSAAKDLQGKINELTARLSDARLDLMLASSDILTPEQRESMRNRFMRHSLRGQKGFGKRGDWKGPGHGSRTSMKSLPSTAGSAVGT